MFTTVQDTFSLGKEDILTVDRLLPPLLAELDGPSDWGTIYVISNSKINGYSGTGNVIDMADSSNYSLLYQGAPRNPAIPREAI